MKKGSGIQYELFRVNPCFYYAHYDHLEIQDFITPENIDIHSDKIIKGYQKLLAPFKGTLSLHAPFQVSVGSMDRQEQNMALNRLSKALLLGSEIGCTTMVVHSCFNPNVNYPTYLGSWVDNAIWFWERFLPLCVRKNMVVAVENIHDRTPNAMLQVLKNFKSPFLRACLDTGHANIFSRLPVEEWIELLGKYLTHLHVHDNHGFEDEHLPVGRGDIDFSWLSRFKDDRKTTLVNEAFGSIKEERAFLEFLHSYQHDGRLSSKKIYVEGGRSS